MPGKTWAEYYLSSQKKLYIENTPPVPGYVTLENTNAWSVAGGAATSYPINWSIRSDVEGDFTNGVSVSFFFVLIFLLPWMADGGGYFIGSSFGKHHFCPNISPKKTIEGVLGGIVFCVASAMLMGLFFQFVIFRNGVMVNFVALGILALLDSVVSVLGDLSFSLIKRSLKIKDYGSIFPGHGGMLDRCDSIIFTAPLVIVLSQFIPFLTVVV